MRPHLMMRAITPLGSIATRASRRDIGQSLSNVLFQGTVLRVREVPGDAATRYTYDVRVQIGSTEATRVTIAGARASESQPGGLELATPEFHPGDQVSCYRVSRSEWIVIGRNPENKQNPETSLALETERVTLAMDRTGYVLAGAGTRGANSVASDAVNLELSSSLFAPAGGVQAAMMRLSASGPVLEHITDASSRLSWRDGVLALATSGSNHERDRLSIPLLIEDSDARPQMRRFSSGGASGTTDAEGITGPTGGVEGSVPGLPDHKHTVGSDLAVVIDINGFLGRLAAVSLSNHMVESQSDLAPEQTVSDSVEVRSAGSAQWRFVGRDARVAWARSPAANPGTALIALLGGELDRGASVLNAIKAVLVQNFAGGFREIPNLEPGSHFPDLENPERRRRMIDIGALRSAGSHLVYNDNICLSAKEQDGLGFIEGTESSPVFAPNLPGLVVDDASNGTQRVVSDADVIYRILGVALMPVPNALANEIIAPDEQPILRYLWSARLKPKLQFAR